MRLPLRSIIAISCVVTLIITWFVLRIMHLHRAVDTTEQRYESLINAIKNHTTQIDIVHESIAEQCRTVDAQRGIIARHGAAISMQQDVLSDILVETVGGNALHPPHALVSDEDDPVHNMASLALESAFEESVEAVPTCAAVNGEAPGSTQIVDSPCDGGEGRTAADGEREAAVEEVVQPLFPEELIPSWNEGTHQADATQFLETDDERGSERSIDEDLPPDEVVDDGKETRRTSLRKRQPVRTPA